MWIKICGNTRLEDCVAAAELGADAVGFVFAAGKRTVTAPQVAAITAHLPVGLEKIGVFTSGDAQEIAETAIAAGLTGVQVHGPLDRSLLDGLLDSRFTGKTIQVLHWRTDLPSDSQRESFASNIDDINAWDLVEGVLLDSQTAVASGGTGVAFDWNAIAPHVAKLQPPVIVAGGLRPENVADAIRVLRPWGIDTSSGVESAPGVKDRDAIARFIANARSV